MNVKNVLSNCLSHAKNELAKVEKGTWYIINNKYYQFNTSINNSVLMLRYGQAVKFDLVEFILESRLALKHEVEQHINFMNRNGKQYYQVKRSEVIKTNFTPDKCEFYMVTCRGQMGTKVRHNTYEIAEKEAIRIAEHENHETWILGVVAKVKPKVSHVVTKNFA